MLFELKAGREINLEFIVSMNKHSEHYEICLAGGHKYHIPESKYLEIKKYFDAKNLKGVFVDGEKVAKNVKAVVEKQTELKGGVVGCSGIKSSAYLNIYQKDYLDTLKNAWNVLPPFHDIQNSAPKPEKDYLSEAMEKIRQENADCKKCANAKIECNTCLVYHGGKHHFTNLKVTGESVKSVEDNEIHLLINLESVWIAKKILKTLVDCKFIKNFKITTYSQNKLFTITKG